MLIHLGSVFILTCRFGMKAERVIPEKARRLVEEQVEKKYLYFSSELGKGPKNKKNPKCKLFPNWR